MFGPKIIGAENSIASDSLGINFLKDRKAAVRLDEYTRAQKSIEIGVFQESSVAPILFTLFTALMFCLFPRRNEKVGLDICRYFNDG